MKKTEIRATPEMLIRSMLSKIDHGGLGQIFLLEAINHYAKTIANGPTPQDDPDRIVNPKVWHAIATEVRDAVAANDAIKA